ncbi:MAG: elongation factor P [Candidatus Marinimicrobia bacterium]|nr:elongation factor P [Candidatus Neomarinimicrobiota bacterium]MDD5583332.1 elongation factor P [Candidatus Neomarinimicrobiota bacterium]
MATTADFRNGMVIVYNGALCKIVEFQHSKMGRGGAVVRTKLKNIVTGQVLENTFRSGEKVEEARVEAREMEYLYNDGSFYYVMDHDSFDQIPIPADLLGNDVYFIKENDFVKVLMYQNEPIGIELPTAVVLKVTGTEPGVRGNTATNVTKPATCETGLKVQVPLFINEGDYIKVDTRDGSYLSRENV